MDVSQKRLLEMLPMVCSEYHLGNTPNVDPIPATSTESEAMAVELLRMRDVLAHYPTECLIGAMARSTQGSCACGNRLCVEATRCRALLEAEQ